MDSVDAGAGIAMPREAAQPSATSWVRTYGLALACVAIALGLAFVADLEELDKVIVPLFLAAIAVTVWYAGTGPGIVAILLSGLAVSYFFTPPLYSFEIQAVRSHRLRRLHRLRIAGELVQRDAAPDRAGSSQGARPARSGSRGAHPAGQPARPHARHDLRARHERHHHVLEPRSAGALRLDAGAGDRPAGPPVPEDALSRAGRQHPCGAAAHRALGRRAPQDQGRRGPGGRGEPLVAAARRAGSAGRDPRDQQRHLRAQARRGEDPQPECGPREAHHRARVEQPGAGGLRLFHLARPAGAASPHRRVHRAAAEERGGDARREVPALRGDGAGIGRQDGPADRRPAGLLAHRADRSAELPGRTWASSCRRCAAKSSAKPKGASIAWKIGALPSVHGDRAMLKLALVNLLGNAVKFTRTRPQAEIEIGRSRRQAERGGDVRQGQRRRLRHEVRQQAVRRVPAPAPPGSVRRHRHRPGHRPAHLGRATAAGSGPKASRTAEPPSIWPCPTPRRHEPWLLWEGS